MVKLNYLAYITIIFILFLFIVSEKYCLKTLNFKNEVFKTLAKNAFRYKLFGKYFSVFLILFSMFEKIQIIYYLVVTDGSQ